MLLTNSKKAFTIKVAKGNKLQSIAVEEATVVTAAQLCQLLERVPPELPVAVCVDRKVSVLDAAGDRVTGDFCGAFEIAVSLKKGQLFHRRSGFTPAVFLELSDEV